MYTALAGVYDLFGESDEKIRADYYMRFISGSGMDLGCGTGALTLELLKRSVDVYGVDSSSEMLNRAVTKASSSGITAKFVLGDAQNPPITHKLNFIIAANDVYNYLPKLDKAFENAYNALEAGGTLAFDISSEYKLKNVLAGNTFTQTENGVTYVWQNEKRGNKVIIDFTVFEPQGGLYSKSEETQIQYIHSVAEVEQSLKKAGFASVKTYEFLKTGKPAAKSLKIAFIAKK